MTTIEQIKTELREIIERKKQVAGGEWVSAYPSRNLTPKMAKALLAVIERLERTSATVEIAMHGQPTRRTLHAIQADGELETIRREWEVQP